MKLLLNYVKLLLGIFAVRRQYACKGDIMSEKRPTIRDIAQEAGVSPASVSMILNQKNLTRFSDDTVRLVQAIAARRGYQLKHPRRGTDGTVMIICPSVMNPYYATLIQSMEQEAMEQGFSTAIRTTYWNRQAEARLLEYGAASPDICGIIFAMIPQQPELARATAQKLPMVAVGDHNQDLGIDTVDVNNFHAGELVGRHLIELGHQNIGYISTALNAEHSARVRRCDGLRSIYQSLCPTGRVRILSVDISSHVELNTTDIEHDVGFQLAQQFMNEHPKTTALAAINDMVAYGVIDGLRAMHLRVPEDVSVTGFDNIFPSQFSGVRLTTVEHSILERGRIAFRLMADRLSRPERGVRPAAITRVEYQSTLIVRGTTGPARIPLS